MQEMERVVTVVGALNVDLVYSVPHLVAPGETLEVLSESQVPGGKGLNQAVACALVCPARASASHCSLYVYCYGKRVERAQLLLEELGLTECGSWTRHPMPLTRH